MRGWVMIYHINNERVEWPAVNKQRGDVMGLLIIKYTDGSSEEINNVFNVIDHGCGEISFFIGSGWTRYHTMDVDSFEFNEYS